MSDDQTWRAPGSNENDAGAGAVGGQRPDAQPPVPPLPRYGEYAPQTPPAAPQYGGYPQGGYQQPGYPQGGYQQPGYPPPGYGWQQPNATPGAQPGWAPPPKPGLIPLRPLAFGTLIGAPFQALRRNPRITVGAALLLQGVPTIVVSVLITAGVAFLFQRIANAEAGEQDAITAGAIGGSIVLGVLSIVISTVFSAVLQGVIVSEVARETLGDKLTFRALWRFVRGRVGTLIGYTFLFALAWLLAIALVVGVVVALAALGGPAGVVGAVLAGFVGGLGLIAVAVWINTKLAIVPSAIVIERLPLGAAIVRAWRLTNRNFWRTFGVIALIWLIVYAVTQIITVPFSFVGGMLGGIFAPTSLSTQDPSSFSAVVAGQLGITLVSSIVGAIIGAIGSVVQTAAVALIYIDLRMRKEGLDLELVRFVEARQTGQDLPDPFTQPAPAAPAAPSTPWPGA
ncbi:hypothetical protein [Leifsonia sp. NPDC080035]|uniref:DUF7847 domain-containing protein n=1 Tax=Leifsonia sp. NPDC080035 TaxID=3143936 RepID=A0AAU7G9E5_9MICO